MMFVALSTVIECQGLPEDFKRYELHQVKVLDNVPVNVSPCVLKKANYVGKECLIICYCPTQTTKEVNTAQYFEYLRTCFQVKHDNIVNICGIYCLSNSPYPALVIEEVEPLSTFVKGHDFSEKQQISILLGIARAISAFATVPSVLVKAMTHAVFVFALPEGYTVKFFPIFGYSYFLVAADTNGTSSPNVQCLYEITMFLNSQGQTIEGDLPAGHVLAPIIRGWFQSSSPLAMVTEELQHIFRKCKIICVCSVSFY